MRRFCLLAAVLLLLPLVGCKHETTPDEAMKVMATGMLENKPQLYWETLPPSYQKDVDGLVKDFAGKMDPQIWDSGFGVAKKVVRVLKEKKEFILDSPMLPLTKIDPKVLAENWDDVVAAASILVNSDISQLDQLKQLNIQEFLSTTGADLMEHANAVTEKLPQAEGVKGTLAEVKNAKFVLVKMEGDTATVNIESPNQPVESVEMVKVEGKWILKEVADNWQDSMKKAREFLAGLNSKEMQENKEGMLATMKMVDSQLNLLLDSKTSEDFNGKLSGIAMSMMMGGGGGGPSTSFGGDFGHGPGPLGVEDMPEEEGAAETELEPKKKGFEDKTTNGDDPLFEGSSGEKPESDDSAGETPAEEPESEAPAEEPEAEIPADESEKDASGEESATEAPAEGEKPE